MKIMTKSLLKIMFVVGILFQIVSNANLKSRDNLDPAQIEAIKSVFKLGLKTSVDPSEGTAYSTCMELMTQIKYMKELSKFFNLLTSVFAVDSPNPVLTSKVYGSFVDDTGKKERLKNGSTCNDVIRQSFTDDGDLNSRSRKMKEEFAPFAKAAKSLHLPRKAKDFITAFTGVHRFTKESRELIPKLNIK